jgi:hypothetical protein
LIFLTITDVFRRELAGMPAGVQQSTLAAAALDLCVRLDDEVPDHAAAGIVRELRLVLAELRTLSAAGSEGLDVGDAAMGD